MLLSINGNETVFEHEGVNMDGPSTLFLSIETSRGPF